MVVGRRLKPDKPDPRRALPYRFTGPHPLDRVFGGPMAERLAEFYGRKYWICGFALGEEVEVTWWIANN